MFPIALAQMVGWTALALTCAAAAWRGERPERLGAALIAVTWILSTLVEQRSNWLEPQYGILTVDIATLFGLAGLAFVYRRGWAICAAAFQAVAVLTHLAFVINPAALYRAYYMDIFSIGFLLLGADVGGILLESARSPFSRRR
jgi:hypothetical protein